MDQQTLMYVRTYVNMYQQSRDNQNSLDRWVTKFSKVWGSEGVQELRYISYGTKQKKEERLLNFEIQSPQCQKVA